MYHLFLTVTCVVIAYLLGTIPSGYLVARIRGVNIQQVGSGNIGATNVLRSVGLLPAILVVILDPLKGVLAVLLPMLLGVDAWGVAASGLAVVLGNNYNVFLKFRGGKGIATSIGVLIALSPAVGVVAVLAGVYTIALGRFVSLGSLVGIFVAPLILLLTGAAAPVLALGMALAALATWRHRENIVRLAAGSESRIGQRVKPPAAPVAPPEPQVLPPEAEPPHEAAGAPPAV